MMRRLLQAQVQITSASTARYTLDDTGGGRVRVKRKRLDTSGDTFERLLMAVAAALYQRALAEHIIDPARGRSELAEGEATHQPRRRK